MCAYNGERVAGSPLRADGEGDEGGGVASQVILAAGLEGGVP